MKKWGPLGRTGVGSLDAPRADGETSIVDDHCVEDVSVIPRAMLGPVSGHRATLRIPHHDLDPHVVHVQRAPRQALPDALVAQSALATPTVRRCGHGTPS